MKTFDEALDILHEIGFQMPSETVALNDSWNRVLREEIFSDINMPPFDKSAMDGYACRKDDLPSPLRVIGTLYAGSSEIYKIEPGTCVKIMTGAPVPAEADTVIMTEYTEQVNEDHIRFTKTSTKSNICKLGEDIHKYDKLLEPGTLLLPHHLAVLASAGYELVKVSSLPRVALVTTGNELVEPAQTPDIFQIRNSNAYNLIAQIKSLGINAKYVGIVPDKKDIIHSQLSSLFKDHDLVILTGGASHGEHDYVPEILKEFSLDTKFNKLAIQPGKPVSFAQGKDKFCFGLSGNPVSSYLQFELLVKPFIFGIMAHDYRPPIIASEMAESLQRKNADRLKFIPVCFNRNNQAEAIKFNGSAHITGLSEADGFALFPKDCEALAAGDKTEVLLIR